MIYKTTVDCLHEASQQSPAFGKP